MYGGIYSGKDYNFIVFGQENKEENDGKESIRIVKYDKEFNRISSVSVSAGQTKAIIPLDFTARMAEHGDQLILHTARTRYKSSDGKNHQSNLDIYINTKSMKATYVSGLFPKNHVSHSFDTYVLFNGNIPVFLDHGDAYPRSVFLQKDEGSSIVKATMFAIPGDAGANETGVTVGGFEMTSSHYLTAITTIDHSKVTKYTNNSIEGLVRDQRNIVICSLHRKYNSGDTAKQIVIGKYIGTNTNPSSPQLLKISNDKLAVLWGEFSLTDKKYVID